MSGKVIEIKFNERRGMYYISWGNETFYDEDDCLMEWEDPEAAASWLAVYHPELYDRLECKEK